MTFRNLAKMSEAELAVALQELEDAEAVAAEDAEETWCWIDGGEDSDQPAEQRPAPSYYFG